MGKDPAAVVAIFVSQIDSREATMFRQMLSVALWNPFPRTARSMVPGEKHSERNMVKGWNIDFGKVQTYFPPIYLRQRTALFSAVRDLHCTRRQEKCVQKRGNTKLSHFSFCRILFFRQRKSTAQCFLNEASSLAWCGKSCSEHLWATPHSNRRG